MYVLYMYISCVGFGVTNVELTWDDGHLTVFTTRPIRAREQLLLDYGPDADRFLPVSCVLV